MHKFFLPALFTAMLFACNLAETEPKIVLGREWNAKAQVVADTTSQFRANDAILVQMDNGKPFPGEHVELRVYQGETDRILFKRNSTVKRSEAKLTIKGPESKPLMASELLRTSTPGTYRIAFAVGDSVLLEKRMELVK